MEELELNTYIEKISDNVLSTSYENFDQEKLENAKYRIIDVLGCVISGANAAGNLALIDLVKAWGGRKDSTILVHGGKAPAYNVAMVNSVMARSYDFEATQARVNGVNIPSHISGTTVTTALTLGEAKDINGKELISALLVGDDVACRILAASGFGFAAGWANVGTVNALGATAIAGRLLGLSKKQLQNAFGLVLNQLAGSFQTIWDGSPAFKLVQGLSARNGIFSAELAKAGWTGPKDALLGEFGYFRLYTGGCADPEILIEDLGKKYHTEVTYKPYPGCRANHTAIECALNFVNKYDVEIVDIEQIILKVSSMVRSMFIGQPFIIRDVPQIDAAFSIRFCVANILLRKGIALEHYEENLIRDPRITDIANKIIIEEFDNSDTQIWAASLKIKMKDGKEYTSDAEFAKGEPVFSPLSKEEVKQKFMNNIAFSQIISEMNAKKIIHLVENLEEVDNIRELIKLIRS
jgi:2-methylcitrate dehydratase PrpD